MNLAENDTVTKARRKRSSFANSACREDDGCEHKGTRQILACVHREVRKLAGIIGPGWTMLLGVEVHGADAYLNHSVADPALAHRGRHGEIGRAHV